MDIRPTDTSSRLIASRLQRRTSVVCLLLVVAAGLALLGLALVVPRTMSADAAASAATSDSQPQATILERGSSEEFTPAPPLPGSLARMAAVTNGGFETGDLTGWTTGGSANHVEVLQASNFTAAVGPVPTPTEGNYFALLCTGPGEVNSASQGNIDLDPSLTDEYDTSILTKTIHLTPGDVPATLRFDWSFLTAEAPNAPDAFDDFFQVTLNGALILVGSRQIGGVSPYPDVATNGVDYDVTSSGSTNGCSFDWGRSNFQTFRTLITNDGTYTLVFLVADQGDTQDDSGLLIDNLQVTPEIDLEITKTATPDPAIAGEPLVYEVTVINHGTGRAEDVVVTDTLPAEVDFITDTLPIYTDPTLPQGCTFNSGNNQLVCDLGDVLGGESVSFEIEVDVDSDALANGTEALENTAEVDSLTADGNSRNDIVILKTILQDSADLRVVKTSTPDTSVQAGEIFTYTIFVDNLGPSHARNVVLTDTILSSGAFTLLNVIPDSNRSDSCSINGTIITCELGQSLEPQGDPPRNGRWVIEVRVRADEAQDVNNEVIVFSTDPDGSGGPQTATPDPDTSNNRVTDFISVTAVADLKMTKIGVDAGSNPDSDPYTVLAGETISWTITVVNDGPSTSENVVVVDILPRGLVEGSVVAIAETPSPGGGQCTLGTPGDPNEPLICQLGNLAPTDTATVTIVADVDPSYVADQPNTPYANHLPNDAYLTSDTFDPEQQNNIVFDAFVEVLAQADLGISKAARGDKITGYDPVTQQYTKVQLDNQVTAGEMLQYTLVVSNTGPSDAQNVVISDTLPPPAGPVATVHFVAADGADCRQDPIDRNEITCDLGTMPDETSRIIYILVWVDPSAAGPDNMATITNTATITSTTTLDWFDGDPWPGGNNLTTNTTTVNAVADIFVTKVDVPAEARLDEIFEPDKAIAGNEHRYLITFGNDGPSVARSVVVTDTLDLKQAGILGETFVRCEPVDPDDEVTCSEVGGIVSVDELLVTNEAIISAGTGTLNPDDEFSFYLITKVDPGYVLDADVSPVWPSNPLIARNRADIGTSTTDYHGQNNYDSEDTEIIAEADLKVTKTDTPDPGQNLYYDPVTNKFVYTYTLTIENLGPSDAAKVVLIDTLPVDATFIEFGTLEDTQCYFRDDGTVFCLVGEDRNNEDDPQAGRLNAGSSKVVEIVVEADASAVDFLENCVEVKAIAEDEFPFNGTDPAGAPIPPADFQDGRTPTPDPNLANNTFCETTSLVNPVVEVDKKVYISYSPERGIDNRGLDPVDACADLATDDILTLPGDELTYCYTITNEGDTWLSSIKLQDQSDANIVRTPTSDFTVAYPSQPPLRGTITVAGAGEAQTITIETAEPAKAVLAPQGVADDYDHILIVRSFTVDFPAGGVTYLGTNTARVDARPSTKYSTPLPGIEPSGDCENPDLICDTDLLHDTLALPVLEDATKEWYVYDDVNEDGLPGCDEIVEYTVTIPNTGTIEATGVVFTDTLYNYIADDPEDPRVPATLINGSVSAALHVHGRDPVSGREIDADVQPPDLAFGEDLLLRTAAPTVDGGYLELTYISAVVLDEEIIKGNNPGDDEVIVATRLAIPPQGYLLRFDGTTYDPPILVTFSLRIRYRVHVKENMSVDTVVLNQGWVSYNEIGLFDQRYPDFDPANPDAHTAANKAANNHAGTPGRAWEDYEFPGWPEVPEGVEPTDYPGPRFDDYAQPGADLRDDDDPTWFEVKCGTANSTNGTGTHLQLPAIDHQGGWETRIQVQNAGDDDTGVIVFFWGEYSGQCPYNDPGPVGYACKWVDKDGVWSLQGGDIPGTAKSAIVYSVAEGLFDQACLDAAQVIVEPNPYWDPRPKSAKWQDWVDLYEGTGLQLAVITQREGPNDFDTLVSSAYPGISENMKGCGPPYQYFAPYAMSRYHGLDTEMIIQNCGKRCTEVWLDYQKQGTCEFSYSDQIGRLAPGESIRKRVPAALGAEWLGSIYIESDEQLGIVMDQTSFLPSENQGTLLSYEAFPYDLTNDKVWYADLVFRELSGWEASIQVQNLTQDSLPTFVTVEFFDANGDSILFLGEWVCLHGGATFYLPAIVDLGMTYAGAAVIQSHEQVDYPGGMHDGEPIFVVVDLKKTKMYDETLHRWRHTVPGEIQGGAYNARAESDKAGPGPILLPFLSKARNNQGVTSLIAIRNNSNCNNIAIELEVRKGTGTVLTYVSNFWLNTGHVKLIDLANVGSLKPGFVGSGTIEVVDAEQLCDTDGDGQPDQEPVMPSVVVVNRGAGPGDITAVYKGIRGGTHE